MDAKILCTVDTANSAFDFYYLPPMPYLEGKKEMVYKYGLFDGTTYDYLYSHFGGHTRFYVKLWTRRNGSDVSYNDTMAKLITESKRVLNSCLMHLYDEMFEVKSMFFTTEGW